MISRTSKPTQRNAIETDCKRELFELEGLGRRRVEADFSAGRVSSDVGGLLLREVDHRVLLTERLAHCFLGYRLGDTEFPNGIDFLAFPVGCDRCGLVGGGKGVLQLVLRAAL